MRLTLENLKSDRLLWSQVIGNFFQPPASEVSAIATAAFDALDHWGAAVTSERNNVTGPAIDGAFNAIQHFVEIHPDAAYTTCRRVGSYFWSSNINVAFTAIHRFGFSGFSRYTTFVSDLLIAIATSQTVPKSPIEMTLRGAAFYALFGLNPYYKHWTQLHQARDECVCGLLSWGGGRVQSCQTAAQIMRYVRPET